MLIDLAEGFYCDPESVVAVVRAGEESCSVYLVGQPIGFAVAYPAADVVSHINDALAEPEETDSLEQ